MINGTYFYVVVFFPNAVNNFVGFGISFLGFFLFVFKDQSAQIQIWEQV